MHYFRMSLYETDSVILRLSYSFSTELIGYNTMRNVQGGRGTLDFYLLQGLGLFFLGSKFLISLFFFFFFEGVEILLTIFMGMPIWSGVFWGVVIFHRYFWGCQFKNVYLLVFLLYKVL